MSGQWMQMTPIASLSMGVLCAPTAIGPGGPEVESDRSSSCRPVLHLNAVEGARRVRHKVERRMLGRGEQHVKTLANQVGMRFCDAEIAFVFGVMSAH